MNSFQNQNQNVDHIVMVMYQLDRDDFFKKYQGIVFAPAAVNDTVSKKGPRQLYFVRPVCIKRSKFDDQFVLKKRPWYAPWKNHEYSQRESFTYDFPYFDYRMTTSPNHLEVGVEPTPSNIEWATHSYSFNPSQLAQEGILTVTTQVKDGYIVRNIKECPR
jgi:hypothetical protein